MLSLICIELARYCLKLGEETDTEKLVSRVAVGEVKTNSAKEVTRNIYGKSDTFCGNSDSIEKRTTSAPHQQEVGFAGAQQLLVSFLITIRGGEYL